jgi:hypothetical protein
MIRYVTEIDHHDHEAMIALEEETGEGIGVARTCAIRSGRLSPRSL